MSLEAIYLLTPMDIHDHQFKKSFRGYSENEVDDFLDKVVTDFEKLINDNERLKTQLYTTETELEKYRGLEKTMNDTLMVAQRTADEVISSAKKNADNIKEQTARECQQIKDQAQFEAKQLVDAANVKRDAVLAEYDKFLREKNAFLLKLRTILESELTITTQMLEEVPSVAEAVKQILPEEKPIEKPAEKPVEVPKPEEKVEEINEPTNIVDISTKPVTDETRTYKPVLDKENVK